MPEGAMGSLAAELESIDGLGQCALVRRGEVSRREVVEAAIERIETANPRLNAVVTPMFDSALEASDDAGPGSDGPLAGFPYAVKDLVVEIPGVRFTEGSRFLADYVSSYESELAARLRRAGVIVVGKTNTTEFGMLPACEPALFGPTRNPWDTNRSTSGSSGGSAAAVASRMVPAAHANDLGGSIRYPASACGLFGLKPTRGRNPLGPQYGDAISGWACEHAVTRTVRDSAALLDATAGPAVGDPYIVPTPQRPFSAEVGADPGRLRIGYTPHTADGTTPHVDCTAALDHAVGVLDALGHDIVEVEPPAMSESTGRAIGTVFSAAGAWIVGYWIRELGREPGPDDLEPCTRAYWQAGRRVTAGDYLLAIEELQRFARQVAQRFTDIDVLINPTMSAPPLPIGAMTSTDDDPWRAARVGGTTVAFAGVIANLTGNPAMSIPLWWNQDNLPIGVHALGRYGDEATLIRLASPARSRPTLGRQDPTSRFGVIGCYAEAVAASA
jgi:amidase